MVMDPEAEASGLWEASGSLGAHEVSKLRLGRLLHRNLMKKPLVLHGVLDMDASIFGIWNQGFLIQVPN